MRIVSLLPSATEIVYALGLEPVGVSHECDYPPEATAVPSINRSRVDPDASSEEINRQVVRAERDHGGVYEIALDALADADPDLVITQGVCDVCAVDSVLVERAVAELDLDADVLTTDTHSLGDLFEDVRRIGEATDRSARAERLVAELRDRIEAVEERAARATERPRVAVLDWLDPVMIAGHWMPELVDRAGGRYGMAGTGERSRPREWDEVRSYDPDVLIVAPCGFEIEQTMANRSDVTDRDGWDALTAVRNDRVYAMDGHHYVNRPGPRLVDTLEHLAGLLHPDRFDEPPASAARPLTAPAAER